MIQITIPHDFVPERTYILDILLGELAGLDYHIGYDNGRDYRFLLDNGNRLIVRDCFFSTQDEAHSYLNTNNIPTTVATISNRFTRGLSVPVIYGNDELKVEAQTIVCGLDIFASAFFMLTRWEEWVVKERDGYERFPRSASLACKAGFLEKPVVNYYLLLLQEMLQFLGWQGKKAADHFPFVLTHDVDALLKWLDWKHVLRTAAGDWLKRGQRNTALQRFKEYRVIQKGQQRDPFDAYDFLMDEAESIGSRARFYFMSSFPSPTVQDNHSPYPPTHPAARRIFEGIKSRGHIIGFHPGYTTYNNKEVWLAQYLALQRACDWQINEGRQHYLRFGVPHTWQLWEDMGMVLDSSCGFSDGMGFRCGTGHPYSVFNVLTRKKLKLQEQPLIFMDSANNATGWDIESPVLGQLSTLIQTARSVGTPVTLLFHNSTFADPQVLLAYQRIIHD